MNAIELLKKYYPEGSEAYNIMYSHASSVTEKALQIAAAHPEYQLDMTFIEEAAMLHDIGCFLTHAPAIYCFGSLPYICHGYQGGELMRKEGYPLHARVCERHTGVGISFKQVIKKELPLPPQDFCPVTMEEKLICFADKFFSKTKLGKEKRFEKVKAGMERHGSGAVKRFDELCSLFL